MQLSVITIQRFFTALSRLLPKWVFQRSSLIRALRSFEAIGINKKFIDTYFTNTVSRIGGITLKDIERDMNTWHMRAFDPLGLDVDLSLDSIGGHKMRSGKEEHLYNAKEPFICFRNPQNTGDYEMFKVFS